MRRSPRKKPSQGADAGKGKGSGKTSARAAAAKATKKDDAPLDLRVGTKEAPTLKVPPKPERVSSEF